MTDLRGKTVGLGVLGAIVGLTGYVVAPRAAAADAVAKAPATRPLVVAADGSGTYKTIQEAVDAVPANSTKRVVITVKPGTYKAHLVIPKEKPFITLRGEDAAKTILTNDLHVKSPGTDGSEVGTIGSASVVVSATDFVAENLTFENNAPHVAQALAIYVAADRAVFRQCRFLGWQDTIRVRSGRQYFDQCYINGRTDFLYGEATAFFDRCQIHVLDGGWITAANTPQDRPYGLVFSRCRITGEPGVTTYLGRPWRDFAHTVWLNTEMADVIRPEGWHNWNKPAAEKTVRYAEYGSKTPDGKPIDLSPRVAWSKRLTAEEAEKYTVRAVLGGTDGWDPASSPSRARADTRPIGDAWPESPTGFASVNALGQNGTTGGRGGKTVTVRNQADLEKYAAAVEPCIIRVEGSIDVVPFGKKIPVASHKTILGLGNTATILHGGFKLMGVSNVILRNLTIKDSYVEGDPNGKTNDFDAIQADDSHHLWIDHCHLSHMGDGILDIRKTSDYITVSWTIFSNHNKVFGIGWTSNSDRLHITIHHNWFRDTIQRNPSFDNGTGHLFNNFLENIGSYGNYARGRAKLVVENSVFVNVKDPLVCAPDAQLAARGNLLRNSPGKKRGKGACLRSAEIICVYAR